MVAAKVTKPPGRAYRGHPRQRSPGVFRQIFIPLCGLLLLATGCGDEAPRPLFQVTYRPVDFVLPAGNLARQSFVAAVPRLTTNFEQERAASNTSVDDIDIVQGFRARIVSISGEDFRQYERAELRFCPVGQDGGCGRFDFMFSTEDLYLRRQTVIDLSPQLKNFRDLFLRDEEVRLEIVLIPGETTSQTIEARLEYTVGAFGE